MKQDPINAATPAASAVDDLGRQRAYVESLKKAGFDFGIVIADAFVRGMRDIGYKSTATALNELIDNAIQANAENVDVLFGYEPKNTTAREPDFIAVLDDGHGMDPEMVRAAVLWGGTHRENDREGFGRYGYGLPSASVSIGRRFSVYSKVEGGKWYNVAIDVDEIGAGKYNDGDGRPIAPQPQQVNPPEWLAERSSKLHHGTVVVIEKVDRLTHRYGQKLQQVLLEQFGLVYRNYLRMVNVRVNGVLVEPIDPLFVTPGCRFYDEDTDRAVALPNLSVAVKSPDGKEPLGLIKARFSLMPPTFLRKPEFKAGYKGGKIANNARFHIRRENNGIIVLRKGRQIDIVRPDWTVFQNYDRYVGVEIDFDPALDEYFRITTSKQQVVVDERIWAILKQNGFVQAVETLRGRFRVLLTDHVSQPPAGEDKLASEEVMEELQKFKTRKPAEPTPEQKKVADENLKAEVKRRADASGVPEDAVKQRLEEEQEKHPFVVERVEHPEATFFRIEQRGGQKVLFINKAHRFFTDVYAPKDVSQRFQRALEVLLFVIGECELESTADRRLFYQTERKEWSKNLEIALDLLGQRSDYADHDAAEDEANQTNDNGQSES